MDIDINKAKDIAQDAFEDGYIEEWDEEDANDD